MRENIGSIAGGFQHVGVTIASGECGQDVCESTRSGDGGGQAVRESKPGPAMRAIKMCVKTKGPAMALVKTCVRIAGLAVAVVKMWATT